MKMPVDSADILKLASKHSSCLFAKKELVYYYKLPMYSIFQ